MLPTQHAFKPRHAEQGALLSCPQSETGCSKTTSWNRTSKTVSLIDTQSCELTRTTLERQHPRVLSGRGVGVGTLLLREVGCFGKRQRLLPTPSGLQFSPASLCSDAEKLALSGMLAITSEMVFKAGGGYSQKHEDAMTHCDIGQRAEGYRTEVVRDASVWNSNVEVSWEASAILGKLCGSPRAMGIFHKSLLKWK